MKRRAGCFPCSARELLSLLAGNALEDTAMTPTRANVEALVVRIQDEFLAAPAVRLTLGQVAQRVENDAVACEAVLHALVDARVLAVTPGGSFQRFFPRTRQSRAA
jgi:hypothetical protein